MEIVWLASAIEDFVSLLEKVDSLFGKAVATKSKIQDFISHKSVGFFPLYGNARFLFFR